jgi:hypothetical protein
MMTNLGWGYDLFRLSILIVLIFLLWLINGDVLNKRK